MGFELSEGKKKEKLQSVVGFEPSRTVKLLQKKRKRKPRVVFEPAQLQKKKKKKATSGFEPALGNHDVRILKYCTSCSNIVQYRYIDQPYMIVNCVWSLGSKVHVR